MITKPNKALKGTTWCGPYALALIGNVTYEEALKKAKRATGRKIIKGMWNWEVAKVAKRLGLRNFKWTNIPKKQQTNFLNHLDWFKPNRIYVVQVTHHYMILNTRDWTVTDNQMSGWMPLAETKKAKRRFVEAYAEAFRIPDEPVDHPTSSA